MEMLAPIAIIEHHPNVLFCGRAQHIPHKA